MNTLVRSTSFVIVIGFILLWCGIAAAEDTSRYDTGSADPCKAEPYRAVDHRWFFNVTPYLWTPGIFGNVEAFDTTTAVNANTAQMLNNIDPGVGFSAEVGWCRVSLLVDLNYLDYETAQIDSEEPTLQERRFVSTTMMNWLFEPHRYFSLGPMVGLRFVHADLLTRQRWVDPLIGVRGRVETPLPIYFPLYADFGGAGFGRASQVTWQFYGAVGLSLNRVGLELGYRHLYIDFASEELNLQIHTSGPQLGATFRF